MLPQEGASRHYPPVPGESQDLNAGFRQELDHAPFSSLPSGRVTLSILESRVKRQGIARQRISPESFPGVLYRRVLIFRSLSTKCREIEIKKGWPGVSESVFSDSRAARETRRPAPTGL